MKNNILIIDDEVAILQMLVSYFGDKYNIKKAINGKTAMSFIKKTPPDLIITDWMLPDISGVEIVAKVRSVERYKNIPMILLTAKSSENDKIKAFECGTDDYVVKPFSLPELNARIKALLRRGVGDDKITYQNLILNNDEQVFYVDNKILKISGKEFKLLKLLIKNPQRIYTREQIIERIYAGDSEISDRAIDVLISRVRKNLKTSGCDLLQTIRGLGYKLGV